MKKWIRSYFKMFLIFFLAFSTAMGASYKLFETKSKREVAVKVQENKPTVSEKVATNTVEQLKTVDEQASVTETPKVTTTQPKATLAPTQATTATTQSTEVTKMPTENIYNTLHIDINKVVKNSDKFIVTLDMTEQVKAGDNIKFTVKNVPKMGFYIIRAEQYASGYANGSNGTWIDANTYRDTIVIQNSETINGKISSCIFIRPNGEDTVYEYDFTLTLAQ